MSHLNIFSQITLSKVEVSSYMVNLASFSRQGLLEQKCIRGVILFELYLRFLAAQETVVSVSPFFPQINHIPVWTFFKPGVMVGGGAYGPPNVCFLAPLKSDFFHRIFLGSLGSYVIFRKSQEVSGCHLCRIRALKLKIIAHALRSAKMTSENAQ